MKKIKIGLLPRIIIAIILGIAIGTVFPAPLVRIFVTFNGIFSEFLNFSIPLIIVGLVTVAIADIGKGAGKMLLVTALIAYGATLFSVFPSLIEPGVPLEEVSEAQGILPYFSVSIPPLMNVMTALIFAFTLGLGLASLNSDALKNVARDFQEIIVRMISAVILPLLPLYRYFSKHDALRTSIRYLNGIYQNYRSNFHSSYLPAGFPIFHCSIIRAQKSV